MRLMKQLGGYLDAICAVISGLCMIGLILVNFADSIGRQISRPVLGAQEFGSFLLLIFFFSAIPILVRENAHIRVGLFVEMYKKTLGRIEIKVSAVLETLGTLLLIWLVFDRATRVQAIGSLSAHFKVPIYPLLFLGAGIMALSIFFLAERFLTSRQKKIDETVPENAHHIRKDEDQ